MFTSERPSSQLVWIGFDQRVWDENEIPSGSGPDSLLLLFLKEDSAPGVSWYSVDGFRPISTRVQDWASDVSVEPLTLAMPGYGSDVVVAADEIPR